MSYRTTSFLLLTVSCLVFCCFSSATNLAAGCQAPAEIRQALEPDLKFYPLKFINAHQAKNLIENAIDGMGAANVTEDVNANTLIVVGEQHMQQFIQKLITNIDVEPREPVLNDPPKQTKLVPTDGIDAEYILAAVSSLPIDGSVDIRMDESSGVVILTGKQGDVSKVQEMISEIIALSAQSKVTSVNLSMTFVVEAAQLDEKDATRFRQPNAQVTSVLKKATESGLITIQDPRVVCKTVNRVRVRQPAPRIRQGQQVRQVQHSPAFINQSESGGNGFALSGSGYISQLSGNSFELDAAIELAVNSRLADHSRGTAELRTKMEVPLDHPVLLSFSTILGIDSVVIVQVDKAD